VAISGAYHGSRADAASLAAGFTSGEQPPVEIDFIETTTGSIETNDLVIEWKINRR
jgi:hypothetical protein